MGQGQEVHARRLLANAILNGGWVLLQNCHLSSEMCVEIVETLTEAETIENSFRLWITTEEQPKFPISLLQVRGARGWFGFDLDLFLLNLFRICKMNFK